MTDTSGVRRPDQCEQVSGVTLIENAEAFSQTERRAIPSQHAVGHRVKRPRLHSAGRRRIRDLTCPSYELGGGPAAEGDKEDPLGGHAGVEQASQAADQHPGLAGAGSGHDE